MIQSEHVSSQEQISKMLESEGIISTQATVSRDLEEIGAVKVRLPGGESGYAIPESAKRPGSAGLSKTLKQYVLSVQVVKPLVIINTPLGCADVTCAALDAANLTEVAGTIAGQDTIFVALYEDQNFDDFAKKIAELSDLEIA